MIRRIRRFFREIEYYSARQTRSVWARRMTIVLFASPVVGLVAAIAAGLSVRRTQTLAAFSGDLERTPSGAIVAPVALLPGARSIDHAPWGEFEARVDRQTAGWPLEAAFEVPQLVVEVNLFSVAGPGPDLGPPADVAAARAAVEARLTASIDSHSAEARRELLRGPAWSPLAWVLNWALLFVASYMAMAIALQLARFGAFRIQSGREARISRRRAKGECPGCGYATRGLEFSDRCPECGQLLD
jgi:hypothetical protein